MTWHGSCCMGGGVLTGTLTHISLVTMFIHIHTQKDEHTQSHSRLALFSFQLYMADQLLAPCLKEYSSTILTRLHYRQLLQLLMLLLWCQMMKTRIFGFNSVSPQEARSNSRELWEVWDRWQLSLVFVLNKSIFDSISSSSFFVYSCCVFSEESGLKLFRIKANNVNNYCYKKNY